MAIISVRLIFFLWLLGQVLAAKALHTTLATEAILSHYLSKVSAKCFEEETRVQQTRKLVEQESILRTMLCAHLKIKSIVHYVMSTQIFTYTWLVQEHSRVTCATAHKWTLHTMHYAQYESAINQYSVCST